VRRSGDTEPITQKPMLGLKLLKVKNIIETINGSIERNTLFENADERESISVVGGPQIQKNSRPLINDITPS
jgi:hypothetical protein